MSKPILCVDFDGVIHSYTSGWQGAEIIPDPPTPGAIQWLWSASKHFQINIYSSRTKHPHAISAMQFWLRKHVVEELNKSPNWMWQVSDPGTDNTGLHPRSVHECVTLFMLEMHFPTQKPAAFLTIDDRAICFDGDWIKLNPEDMLQFKPWNKK